MQIYRDFIKTIKMSVYVNLSSSIFILHNPDIGTEPSVGEFDSDLIDFLNSWIFLKVIFHYHYSNVIY